MATAQGFKKAPRVVIVEDEEDLAELIEHQLVQQGWRPQRCHSGEAAIEAIQEEPPDAVVLDLMLPGMDGLEVCRRLRASPSTRDIPILMLTAKSEDHDVVQGLNQGADDYLGKPFSREVLIARLKALLRRGTTTTPEQTEGPGASRDAVVRLGSIEIHPGRHEVKVAGGDVTLTPTEFKILKMMVRRPGWVFTRAEIVENLWGPRHAVTDRSIDFQMVGLRRKLDAAARSGTENSTLSGRIETVRGVGYRLRE